MDKPEPGEAHRRLQPLIGAWEGKETINPSPWDPAGGAAVARVNNRSSLGGFVVVHEYEQERGGAVALRGHGVFTWDAETEAYVLYWFDSMGMQPNIFRGSFEGNVLTLTCKDRQGMSRATFAFPDKDTYSFRMDVSQDGENWYTFIEGDYWRLN